jgi:uracil-DNA glycosylase
MRPWNDVSGQLLRKWLGVTDEQFYDPDLIALVPMDFYYPGKGTHGDLPPRKGFAEKWHPVLLEHMPNVELIILIGAYAQKYYLGKNAKRTLTETVYAYEEYLPTYFPLVHPSPLNFRWRSKNGWFETDVVPKLSKAIEEILG